MLLHIIARGKIGRGPEAELVDRFASAIESSAHLLVVTVAGDFASLRKPLKAVPGGRVD